MSRRLRRLAGITETSTTDVRILEVLLLYETNPVIESVVDDDVFMGREPAGASFNMRASALPYFLDMSHRAVRHALHARGAARPVGPRIGRR